MSQGGVGETCTGVGITGCFDFENCEGSSTKAREGG